MRTSRARNAVATRPTTTSIAGKSTVRIPRRSAQRRIPNPAHRPSTLK